MSKKKQEMLRRFSAIYTAQLSVGARSNSSLTVCVLGSLVPESLSQMYIMLDEKYNYCVKGA